MTPHDKWMDLALREAESAFERNEVPIGAVVVLHERVIGRGHNLVEGLQDPTAHAEMIAITAAANSLGSWRLEETTLYVTKEPCPMCAGAIFLSRIPQVVFGVSDARAGAGGSVVDVLRNPRLGSRVEVIHGVLEARCMGILQDFFQGLRGNPDS